MQMNNKIYLLNCKELTDAGLYRNACRYVSEARRSSADTMRLEEDKRLTVGAGLLSEYIRHLHPFLPEVRHSEDGKPFFPASDCSISLSHSHDYVMIGIGGAPLGVDLEYYHDDYELIISHFFVADEKAYLDESPDRKKAFFELWSRKEAYIKRNEPRDIRTFSVLQPQDGMEYLSYEIENYSCVAYVPVSVPTEWHCPSISDCIRQLEL